MNKLKPNEQRFWDEYLLTLPESQRPENPFVEASYAGNQKITDELIQLYLTGKKAAGSSLVEDFQHAGDPLPKAGNYWIILDSLGQSKCLVKTLKTVIHKFKDVPKEIAIAEGEGDLSLAYWKSAHSQLYAPHLQKWGISDIEQAIVITEFFEVLAPKNAV